MKNHKEDIYNELGRLPTDIKEQEIKLLKVYSDREKLAETLKWFENLNLSNIVNEKLEGKPVYSNETARQTELITRLSTNIEYQNIRKDFIAVTELINKETIQLNFLKNEFSATKKMADLIAGEKDD